MPSETHSPPVPDHDRAWYVVARWQEFEGEATANLLRILGIAAFYAVELLNYHGLRLGVLELPRLETIDRQFHYVVTALAVAWSLVSLGVLVCLRRRVFPGAMKFVSTACDLAFLTAILVIADGPRSPLVVGYFLVIAFSTLRFSLPLVRFATIGAMCGYLFVLGHAKWFADPERALRVERYEHIIFLLALGLTGIVLGQAIRRVRPAAENFADRVSRQGKNE